MARVRNTKGQFVRKNAVAIAVDDVLKDIAYGYEIRMGALLRDKLADTLRHEIYNSYTPTSTGTYKHTRTLITSVYATIEGDTVQAKISSKKTYPAVEVDEHGNITETTKTARQVYDYLKFGTTKHPKHDVYPYITEEGGDVHFAQYEPTPPHNFETRTMESMERLINKIKADPEGVLGDYRVWYKNKRMKYRN